MDMAEILVTTGGLVLIGFILWFFFGPRKSLAAHAGAGGVQEATVIVEGGYTPDRIEVEAGRPVRLHFVRRETNPCTERVVFDDFSIAQALPFGQSTPVELTPTRPGEYRFHCGMNMFQGRLIVRPAPE